MKEVYPSLEDPQFAVKLASLEEFGIFHIPKVETFKDKEAFEEKARQLCQFEKTYYQHFVSQYLSSRSPYRSMLLYHGLGSGKTCSAITIAEALNKEHLLNEEPHIWILSRKALKGSFEQEIFRTSLLLNQDRDLQKQCTGDLYFRTIPNAENLPIDKVTQKIQKIIKSKYQFFGYDQFANTVNQWKAQDKLEEKIHNKVIIIDEAHNLRNLESLDENPKKIVEPLLDVLENGKNNRLVLLSATPMYNEPEEILWLFSLLLANDHRKGILDPYNIPKLFTKTGIINKKLYDLCIQLSNYVSYIRGNNPFTFAIRLNPPEEDIAILKQVPKTTLSGETLSSKEKDWLSWIPGKLVTSPLGQIQLEAIQAHEERNKKKISSATLRQINICAYKKHLGKDKYEYQEGRDGLNAIFQRADELEPIQYKYSKPKEPIFNPAYGKLSTFATKLDTLQSIIKSSKGIVLIYSLFIWGGIVPTAIMLEHMGFSRYKERDFLNMPSKVSQGIRYEGIIKPSYCILSSESGKDVMGSTTIDDLLKDINSPENKNGEKIKVILISPVAGEGLSFKNIREMHVLDPWYHLNNQEQAIGRAIRNCSHSSLPIEERNVTVYLHTTVYEDNHKETSDLHAYRLAAIKYQQIQKIDKLIQTHAVDCSLMRNINTFPKELFNFTIMMRTSRNKQIPYHYGEEQEKIIQCADLGKGIHDTRSFREESYREFIPTLQQKLKKILEVSSQNSYTYEELLQMIHPNIEVGTKVIQSLIFPYKLSGNRALIYHNNQFILSSIESSSIRATRLQYQPIEELEPIQVDICSLQQVFEQVEKDPIEIAILNVYQALDSVCWKEFAEKIIQTPTSQVGSIQKALKILEREGAFIMKQEISAETPSKYSGYVNLFSDEDKFDALIWDEDTYRELTISELARIKTLRRHVPFTNPMKLTITKTIGMMQRYRSNKEPNTPYRFQFKLGLNNEKGKRLGVVCETGLKKPQIEEEVIKYTKTPMKANVSQLCTKLMIELLKDNKLWLPPIYKMK